jgi:hypothetical protein
VQTAIELHLFCFVCSRLHFEEEKMTTSKCSIAVMTAALTLVMAAPATNAQAPGAATKPVMTAKLVDAEKKAAEKAATVEVTTSGIELVDPALSNEKAVLGQGHLHYQLDKGPVVATPAAKLSYHELTPGTHTILVVLAANDHKPLGPQQQLTVTVPNPATKASTPSSSAKPKAGY